MIYVQSNNLEFLIQKAIRKEPNKAAARAAIIDELSKHISPKRISGILMGSYEPKLTDLLVFSKFFGITDPNQLLNVVVGDDFKTLDQTLEQLKVPIQN